MDLQQTMKVNNQIMTLIESKHPAPTYTWPRNAETAYYERLVLDTHKARNALRAGGIAPHFDNDT